MHYYRAGDEAMRYRVQVDGQEREIDVQITPGGSVVASVGGVPVDAEIRPIPGGVSLRLAGRTYDVLVGGDPSRMQLCAGAIRATVSVESERQRKRAGARGRAMVTKELRAPMPGRIVKVMIKVGDDVAPKQPLIVMEAMKMENELRAEAPAKVVSVEVSEGQNVDGNALLIRFA